MDFRNFLEKLYFSHLDMETFRNYPDHDFKEQIKKIIAQYDEISRKFPLSKAKKSDMIDWHTAFTEKARQVNKLSFRLLPSQEEKLHEILIDRIYRDAQVNTDGN
jgi:hypothetical protein